MVIDGQLAFVGGIDLAAHRWDQPSHLASSPLRCDGPEKPYGPYHDLQVSLVGPAAARLVELFRERWAAAGGGPLSLAPAPPLELPGHPGDLPIDSPRVAIAQTRARTLLPSLEPIAEIRRLYLDAIAAAERLIYIESQYLTSRAMQRALLRRMLARARPKLDIVFVLPQRPEALTEELALGITQARVVRTLQAAAERGGHALGLYHTVVCDAHGCEEATYVHSKLLIVDDRLLTIGSANATNRSMGLDTELNVAFEAAPNDWAIISSISDLRAALLLEHMGLVGPRWARRLRRDEGSVALLDELAGRGASRLRPCRAQTIFDESELLRPLADVDLTLDPDRPGLEEAVYELMSAAAEGWFARGLDALREWLAQAAAEEEEPAPVHPEGAPAART